MQGFKPGYVAKIMPFTKTCLKTIKKIVGSQYCSAEKEDLACYRYDAGTIGILPDAVVFPEDAAQISKIVKKANKEKFSIIPRGAGTGMTGGSITEMGGLVVVTSRMNRIIDIDTDNLTARVQPGVVTGRIHRKVEENHLFYPPDPSSSEFSTIGGNVAECAGGPHAVKYGVTRDYVLGLEAVLPTGEIIRTGVQTAKGVVGYDLTRLLVGSEGTLGIITEIVLKLLPLPGAVRTMTVIFDAMDLAAKTVSEIIRRNLIPRAIEYMDNASICCAENHMGLGLPLDAGAMLIIEVDGDVDEVDKKIDAIGRLCLSMGAETVKIAGNRHEAAKLWKARKAISPGLFRYGPHKINEDIVVPRSKIPHVVKKIEEMKASTGLAMVSFGHAGDGNIHFNIMLDKTDKTQLEKAEKTVEALFDYTVKLGGTISGEHGVGITKAPHISKEIGAAELLLMKKIKRVFDPNGIMNPGKIF